MKLTSTSVFVAAATIFLGYPPKSESFAPVSHQPSRAPCTSTRFSDTTTTGEVEEPSPCAIDESNENNVVSMTASVLRSASLLNMKGERIYLGDVMTQGTSIVVFLRHMG